MKRKAIVFAASLCLVFLIGISLAAPAGLTSRSGVIDQEQPIIDSGSGTFAIGGPSSQILAQVFTAGINGELSEVQFPIVCAQDGGSLIVEIQATQDGKPSGLVMASQSVPSSSFPAFLGLPSFRSIEFDRPVAPILSGRQYAIVLRAASSPNSCGVFRGPAGDSYDGGRAYFISDPNASDVWVALGQPNGDSDDLPFVTLGHGGGPH